MWRGAIFALCAALCVIRSSAKCMNWCSKHGICTDPGDAGYCICDTGYTGADCSKRMCPKAFDPLTLSQYPARRAIRLSTGHEGGVMGGKLKLTFASESIFLNADALSLSSEACTSAVKQFHGVGDVSCVRDYLDSSGLIGSYVITFNSWSLLPHENNLFNHSGNPPIDVFKCDVSRVDDFNAKKPYCEVTDVVTEDLPEYATCGKHGECDIRTGQCICERGFYGAACSDTTDDKDELVAAHDGPYFTGTVLKAIAYRTADDSFNLFKAAVAHDVSDVEKVVTTISGASVLHHRGSARIDGLTAISSGEPVTLRGDTVMLRIDSHFSESPDAHCSLNMLSSSLRSVCPSNYHLRFSTDDSEVFSVSGDGSVITTGAIHAANGTLIAENGLLTTQNVNILNSLDVFGSVNIEDSVTIGSGFALTPEGMTIDTPKHSGSLLELRSSQSAFDGSILDIKCASRNASVIRSSNSDGIITFDISADGHLTAAALRMHSGGIEVSAGGIDIKSGGLIVNGGLTVASGALVVESQDMRMHKLSLSNDASTETLLSLSSSSAEYSGTALLIEVPSGGNSDDAVFIDGKAGGASVLEISPRGVRTAGSVSAARAVISGLAHLNSFSLARCIVSAGEQISVNAECGGYVDITSDSTKSANVLRLPSDGIEVGSVLVIRNQDSDSTSGDLSIPSQSTVLAVYDGFAWTDVHALHAPIRHLSNIESLQLSNDVSFGNYTVSLGDLQLMSLPRGAVAYSGAGGLLKGRSEFSFSKGVLSVPALRVDNIIKDINANNKTISNLIVQDAELKNVRVSASAITLQKNCTGLMYLDAAHQLQCSEDIAVTENGEILINSLRAHVDARQHSLSNVSILSSDKVDATSLTSSSIILRGAAAGVAVIDAEGNLTSSTAVSIEGDTVTILKLGGYEQKGDVDFADHIIRRLRIDGGSISNIASLSSESVTITGLADTSAAPGDVARGMSVLPDGTLVTDDGKRTTHFSALSVASLTLKQPLDMRGETLQSAVIRNATIVGVLPGLNTEELQISRLTPVASGDVLLADEEGTIGAAIGIKVDATGLLMRGAQIESVTVTERMLLPNINPSSVLGVNADGEVVSAREADLQSLTVDEVTVKSAATVNELRLPTVPALSVLGTDADGRVSAAESVKVGSVQAAEVSADVLETSAFTLRGTASGVLSVVEGGEVQSKMNLKLSSLSLDALESSRLSASAMQLPAVVSASVLGTDSNGLVRAVDSVVLESIKADQANIDNLTVKSALALPSQSSGLLLVESGGVVRSSADVKVSAIKADVAEVQTLTIGARTRFPYLLRGVISVDEDGALNSSKHLTIQSVDAENIAVAGQMSAASLRLVRNEQSGGLLISDEKGFVSISHDVSVSSIASKRLQVSTAEVSNLSLSSVSSSGVLVTSNAGDVSSSDDIKVSSITASRLESEDISTSHLRLTSFGAGILASDVNGVVSSADTISVAEVLSNALLVKSATLQSLRLDSMDIGLLSVDGDGVVTSTSSTALNSLVTTSLTVSGTANLTCLSLASLSDSSTDAKRIVSVNSEGELSSGGVVVAQEIAAGIISADSLTATEILLSQQPSGILSIDDKGKVFSSGDIRSEKISSTVLSSHSAEFGEVSLLSGNLGEVLVLGADNKLTSSSSLHVSDATATSVTADEVHAKRYYVSETTKSGLVMIGESGELSFADADVVLPPAVFESMSVSGEAKLHTLVLPHAMTGRLLSTDASGSVTATDSASIDTIAVTSLSSESAQFGKLSLPLATGVLTIDDNSAVASSSSLTLSSVSTDAVFTTKVDAAEIVLRSDTFDGTVVVRDEAGRLRTSSHLEVAAISAERIAVNRLTISGLVGGSVLTIDDDGVVTSSQSIDVARVASRILSASESVVTPSLTLTGYKSSDSSLTGLLSVTTTGEVRVAEGPLKVNTLNSFHISSEYISASKLRLSNTEKDYLLGVNADGEVVSAREADLQSLTVDEVTVKSAATVNELRLPTVPALSVLGTDADGRVSAAESVKVGSVQAVEVSADVLETSAFTLRGTASGVLSVVEGGKVQASSDAAFSSLSAETAAVSGSFSSGNLRVQSLSSSESKSRLVVAAADGSLSALSESDRLAAIESLLPDSAAFRTLTVSGDLSAASVSLPNIEALGSGTIVGSVTGKLQPVTHATVSELSVNGEASCESLRANSITLVEDSPASPSLAFIDASGALRTSRITVNNKGKSITVSDLAMERVTSDVDFSGNKLRNAVIEASSVRASEMQLTRETEQMEGSLVVRRKVFFVSVSAAGDLLISSLSPSDPKTLLKITNADISASRITSSTHISAAEISADSLTISGGLSVGADLDVDGTIRAKGNVIGSGSYVDSSDARFKRDVSNLTSATQIVNALQAVNYKYRTNEFPEKGFEASPQIGWIAQEVQKVAPELVHTDEDGFLSVAYGRSAAVIAQAVKETNHQVETLEERLERRMMQLERALNVAMNEIERLKSLVVEK